MRRRLLALLLAAFAAGAALGEEGKLVEPKLLKSAAPVYPEREKREKVTGLVVIDILIDEEGKVADTDVVASPLESFSKAADACVRKWRFRPGTKDGVPAAFRQRVTINFRLKETPPPPERK